MTTEHTPPALPTADATFRASWSHITLVPEGVAEVDAIDFTFVIRRFMQHDPAYEGQWVIGDAFSTRLVARDLERYGGGAMSHYVDLIGMPSGRAEGWQKKYVRTLAECLAFFGLTEVPTLPVQSAPSTDMTELVCDGPSWRHNLAVMLRDVVADDAVEFTVSPSARWVELRVRLPDGTVAVREPVGPGGAVAAVARKRVRRARRRNDDMSDNLMAPPPKPLALVVSDFDGVLNRRDQWVKYDEVRRNKQFGRAWYIPWCAKRMLDATMVGRLARLCVEGDAHLVISSSWRDEYALGEFADMLGVHGFPRERVLGKIGREGNGYGNRGEAIARWIRRSGNDVRAHVILDDCTHEQGIAGDAVIRTDADVGLTDRDVERALAILRGEHLHTLGWDANGAPVWEMPPTTSR